MESINRQLHGNPMITVVVPTYNRATLVVEAIESICNQTYSNIEIIVVDDGSTDNTEETIHKLFKLYNRPFRYHKKNNGGCASARNLGIELSSGNLVAFLDSDDRWDPLALENLYKTLNASGADFAFSPAIEIYADGREVINYPVAANRPHALAVEHFQSTNVRNGAVLFRREILKEVGGFDESLKHNEDSDTLQRVAILYKAAYCPKPTVFVRHHKGNKSKNRIEIYRSLLRSSEGILMRYPQFRIELGAAADRRIDGIKMELIRLLIMAGNFDEAFRLYSTVVGKVSAGIQLSVTLKSKLPLVIEAKIRFWAHIFKNFSRQSE